jgi:hypothetical protein
MAVLGGRLMVAAQLVGQPVHGVVQPAPVVLDRRIPRRPRHPTGWMPGRQPPEIGAGRLS